MPTGAQRALLLAEHFGSLPAASLRDAVLCVGVLTLECEKGEGGAGGEEGGEAVAAGTIPGSGLEAEAEAEAEAGVVARIEAVAVPSRRTSMSLEELVSRGGTLLAAGGEDDDW